MDEARGQARAEAAHEPSPSPPMGSLYVAVLVTEILTVLALWAFQRAFS